MLIDPITLLTIGLVLLIWAVPALLLWRAFRGSKIKSRPRLAKSDHALLYKALHAAMLQGGNRPLVQEVTRVFADYSLELGPEHMESAAALEQTLEDYIPASRQRYLVNCAAAAHLDKKGLRRYKQTFARYTLELEDLVNAMRPAPKAVEMPGEVYYSRADMKAAQMRMAA